MQQTGDENFCRQTFRLVKMNASVPVDSRVFMQMHALRKHLADGGLTEVVKPNGRHYTLRHDNALVETVTAGIARRKRRCDSISSRMMLTSC